MSTDTENGKKLVKEPVKELVSDGYWHEPAEVIRHTLVLGLTVGSIALIHWEVVHWLPEDFRLFELIPVKYIADAGHLAAVLGYLWSLSRGSRRRK